MDTIKINCIVGREHCDLEASETDCSSHKGPCFLLTQGSIDMGTICKTVEGKYIHIGNTYFTQDDIDSIGEQIDNNLSSF